MTEAKSFCGHREILLGLFNKHITPKPKRTFESNESVKLDNPWQDSDATDSDKKPENISENSEFHFIRRLRQNDSQKNRKRHFLAPSSLNPDPGQRRKSESDKRDSDFDRDPKFPRLDSPSSKKKKIQKICWP